MPARDPSRGFAVAIGLTAGFAIVEALTGWWSGSLALLADAAHMGSDVFALALAWTAARLSRLGPRAGFSYGFRRAEVLAAVANALLVLGIVGWLLVEAWQRLREPQPVIGAAVLAVAVVGLMVNLAVLWLLHRHDRGGLNSRGAILHVMGDLMGSVAAILAGLVIVATGWTPIDPLLSLLIAVLLWVASTRLLWEAVRVLMEAVPPGLDPRDVEATLRSEGVIGVHDLHLWSLAGDRVLLSAHLALAPETDWSRLLPRLQRALAERHGIRHATLQPEPADYRQALEAGLEPRDLDDHAH